MRISNAVNLFFILAMVIVGSVSCHNPKDELIEFYDSFYDQVIDHDVDSIYNFLTPESQRLVDQLTDEKNMNVDSIISIGGQYNIHSFCINYYIDCLRLGITDPDREDFFTHLATSDCQIFSFSRVYVVNKGEVRLGEESFVSVLREDSGSTRSSWVRIENTDEKAIDLIYTIGLCSKDFDSIHRETMKYNNIKTRRELYEILISQAGMSSPLSESNKAELITLRKVSYEQLKGEG